MPTGKLAIQLNMARFSFVGYALYKMIRICSDSFCVDESLGASQNSRIWRILDESNTNARLYANSSDAHTLGGRSGAIL